MSIKYTLLLICLYGSCTLLNGQESSQYSLYMLQKYALNPAYAGLESTLSATGGIRSQWQELPGAPVSRFVNVHLPLYALKGAGGIKIEQEEFGVEKTLRASVSYNYVYQSPIGVFSGGLGVGFIQKSFDGSLLKTPDGRYEGGLILHNDDRISANNLNGIAPAFSAGLYFAQDYLELGISIENINQPVLQFNRSKSSYDFRSRLNVYGEYLFDIRENFQVTPSFLIKSDLVKWQSDLSVMGTFNHNVYAGLGLRGYGSSTFDAFSLLAGLKINKFLKIFYSIDLSLSSIKTTQVGTHELTINYNFNKSIGAIEKEPIIFNPRY